MRDALCNAWWWWWWWCACTRMRSVRPGGPIFCLHVVRLSRPCQRYSRACAHSDDEWLYVLLWGFFFLPRKPFHFSCLRVLLRACVCVCAYSLREGDLCVMCVVRGRKKKSFPVVVIYAVLRFSTCARNGTPSHSHTCTQAHIARYATHHNSKVRARKFSDEICDLVRATSK